MSEKNCSVHEGFCCECSDSCFDQSEDYCTNCKNQESCSEETGFASTNPRDYKYRKDVASKASAKKMHTAKKRAKELTSVVSSHLDNDDLRLQAQKANSELDKLVRHHGKKF